MPAPTPKPTNVPQSQKSATIIPTTIDNTNIATNKKQNLFIRCLIIPFVALLDSFSASIYSSLVSNPISLS